MEITKGIIDLDKAGRYITEHLLDAIQKKGVYDTMALYESLEWKSIGDTIHILYNYYGMYPDMGVGNGIPISEIASMRGYGKRRAKKWYSPTIYREVARLASSVAKKTGLNTSATILPAGKSSTGSADVVYMAI